MANRSGTVAKNRECVNGALMEYTVLFLRMKDCIIQDGMLYLIKQFTGLILGYVMNISHRCTIVFIKI